MRTTTFYRWSLLLPVAVPAVLAPLLALPVPDTLKGAVGTLLLVSLYALIPYALVAFSFLAWMRRKTEREMRSASFRAPWAMAGMTALLFVAPALLTGAGEPWEMVTALSIMAGLGLALGYAYVGLAHGLLALLRRCGCVERADAG